MTDAPGVPEPPAPEALPLPKPASRRASLGLVLGAAGLLIAGGLALLALSVWQLLQPPPTPLEVVARIQADTVPAEGTPTNYGVAFSYAGYETLLAWREAVPVEVRWAADYEALDITLSCCDASHPYADETRNCGCGHHQALYGLAKRLLTDGYRRAEVQAEINRWRAYMFPVETVQAELGRRGLTDPAYAEALKELTEKGQC